MLCIRELMRTQHLALALVVLLLVGHAPLSAQAPEPSHDVNDLAKQTQNPVANLTSVPLQFNFNTGGDLEARTFLNLNVQPVIPFKVSEHWNVIARTIVPIDTFPVADGTRSSGVGDIQEQLFVTPAAPKGMVWGLGPTFSFPTATTDHAETGTWGIGPTAVVVKTTGPWVLGGLISQLWPLADSGDAPEMDLLTVQPFINYNMGSGWALAFAPIITANWGASSGNEWTIPIGVGITRTTVFNRRPMNLGVNYYYNVVRPDGGAGQQLRFVIALLYPR